MDEPLTPEQRKEAAVEGERRRAAYIEKHPPVKDNSLAPTGWDDEIKPKKRKRK